MATHPLSLPADVQEKLQQAALSAALDYQLVYINTTCTKTRHQCFLIHDRKRTLLFTVPKGRSSASIDRSYAIFESLTRLAKTIFTVAKEAADRRGREDHERTLQLLGKAA